jgi:DNA-binding NarL/FixJ family response regulator
MPISILIADDHAVMRDGLKMILESADDMAVVAMVADGREAVARAEQCRPDVILMDISMPGLNGIEATRLIRERLPAVRVLILTMHGSMEHVYRALQAGARGYLLKESAGSEVVTAVRSIMDGDLFFGSGVEQPLELQYGAVPDLRKSPLNCLSRREREVLQLLAEGKNTKEAAFILKIGDKTVETHRAHIMKKLNINSVADLTKLAIREGLTTLN